MRLLCHLSPRQREILKMIAEEETTLGMALALGISSMTVEWHRMELMKTTRIFNYIGLTKLAIFLGLVDNPATWKTWKTA